MIALVTRRALPDLGTPFPAVPAFSTKIRTSGFAAVAATPRAICERGPVDLPARFRSAQGRRQYRGKIAFQLRRHGFKNVAFGASSTVVEKLPVVFDASVKDLPDHALRAACSPHIKTAVAEARHRTRLPGTPITANVLEHAQQFLGLACRQVPGWIWPPRKDVQLNCYSGLGFGI